jgi:RNase P/RNase MRP subunit POP5
MAYKILDESNERELIQGLTRLIGELGMADAQVMTISYNPQKKEGVIRTTAQGMMRVRAALTLLPCTVTRASGTLKTLKR